MSKAKTKPKPKKKKNNLEKQTNICIIFYKFNAVWKMKLLKTRSLLIHLKHILLNDILKNKRTRKKNNQNIRKQYSFSP